ncbi:hypothetical protein ACH5A7_20755 [Streptomyces sp. NPDC018955]|uniref:hypothetical protein n=1 Tax=Streptomyces sp. NPDC018955 TaxID=3365055 RepID=UPI0037A42EC3
MAIELPDDLVELERAAWAEIQAGQLTVPTADAVQKRLTEFAAEAGVDRYKAEMELKRIVRHGDEG